MIFPDVEAVLRLDAFAGNAGAHHLGQSIDVDGVKIERFLDFLAHRVGPRLGTENADAQR